MHRLAIYCAIILGLITASCTSSTAGSGAGGGLRPEAGPTGPDQLAFDRGGELGLDVVRLALRRPESTRPFELSLSDQAAVIVSDLLYDGLTEAVGREQRLRPALALDWWANDGFTEWTFLLDTERATAPDVVEHFHELLAIEGDPAVSPLLETVESVDVGAYADEVVFTLDESEAGFAWLVSGLGVSHVDRADVDAGGEGFTGRYRMVDVAEDEAVLEPVDGRSALPDVVITWTGDDRAAYDLLTLGVVDAAVAPVESLVDAESRFGHEPSARSIVRFYALDVDSPRLVDGRLRSAVLQAIDREALVGEPAGAGGLPVDGLLAPGLAGFSSDGCGAVCAADPDAAAAAITGIGTDGANPPLTVAVPTTSTSTVGEAIADSLVAAGFDVTVAEHAPSELAAAIGDGSADLFASGWVAGAASIDAVVPALLGDGSQGRALGIRSPEIDELIAEARMTADDEQRWARLSDAQSLALQQGRVVPVAAAHNRLVVAPPAAGLVIRADGSLDLEASR